MLEDRAVHPAGSPYRASAAAWLEDCGVGGGVGCGLGVWHGLRVNVRTIGKTKFRHTLNQRFPQRCTLIHESNVFNPVNIPTLIIHIYMYV